MMPFPSMTFVNPMRVFAVRGVASLDVPETDAEKKRLRTALRTVLAAADVDTDRMGAKATLSNKEYAEHTIIVWYDVACDALRVFAPTTRMIDDTTASALELLNGSVHADLTTLPIEDLDAVVRVLALMSGGGEDARDLHARVVVPNLNRYDEDFVPPTVEELEEMWGVWFQQYAGGTSSALAPIEAWISRAYAFGTGAVPPARPSGARQKTAKKKSARRR